LETRSLKKKIIELKLYTYWCPYKKREGARMGSQKKGHAGMY
jgi:hypothetical protein